MLIELIRELLLEFIRALVIEGLVKRVQIRLSAAHAKRRRYRYQRLLCLIHARHRNRLLHRLFTTASAEL